MRERGRPASPKLVFSAQRSPDSDSGNGASNGNYIEGSGWSLLQLHRPMRAQNECSEGYMNVGENLDNDGMPLVARRRRRWRVQSLVTQLPQDSYSLIDEYESEEDD